MSRRVFVVEDQRSSFELISEIVDLVGGFRIVNHCTTEGTALQWLYDHPDGADLVVLDHMLSEGSGFSVLAHLANRKNAPAVVVLSDFASPGIVAKCLAAGAAGAISKADYRKLRTFLEGVTQARPIATASVRPPTRAPSSSRSHVPGRL